MAENEDESLIGYDPLAWLHETSEQEQDTSSAATESFATNGDEEQYPEAEVVTADPDDVCEDEPAFVDQTVSAGSERAQQIVLDSVQTIQNVAELHEHLLHALNHGNKIDIDASAVTMIDTATLQLLLVLKQTAINLQKQVTIDFPSERFMEAAELLGLAEMLEVDQAAAGFF
ncbi:MAG: STAS domain-containing protein [Methylomonas sp.]|nr:STAS domain-containing protein [Methylomonas sp.]